MQSSYKAQESHSHIPQLATLATIRAQFLLARKATPALNREQHVLRSAWYNSMIVPPSFGATKGGKGVSSHRSYIGGKIQSTSPHVYAQAHPQMCAFTTVYLRIRMYCVHVHAHVRPMILLGL